MHSSDENSVAGVGGLAPGPGLTISERLRFGSGWNIVGAVFGQGTTFAVGLIVANLLGRESFGRFTLTQVTLVTIASMAQLATGYTATRYTAQFRLEAPAKTGRILALLFVVSALMAGIAATVFGTAATFISRTVFHAPELEPLLRLLTPAIFALPVNGYLLGLLAGFEQYRAMARNALVGSLLTVTACVAGTMLYGLRGAVGALVIGSLGHLGLNASLALRVLRAHGITLAGRFSGEWWVVRRTAIPAAIAGLTTFPAFWLASAALARQEDGFHEVALYSAASSFRFMVLFVPSVANSVGVAVLNSASGVRRGFDFRRGLVSNAKFVIGAAIVGSATAAVAGPLLLRLYGDDFGVAYWPLLLLLAAALIDAAAMATYQVIQAYERLWSSLFLIAIPRDVGFVLLAIALAARGAGGVATAYLLCSLYGLAVTGFIAYRVIGHARALEQRGAPDAGSDTNAG